MVSVSTHHAEAHVSISHLFILHTGDSLFDADFRLLKNYFKDVQIWLGERFGGKFKELGDTLPHGIQDDASSCGICTANTIAHAVLKDSIYQHASRSIYRAKWYLIAVQNKAADHPNKVHFRLIIFSITV